MVQLPGVAQTPLEEGQLEPGLTQPEPGLPQPVQAGPAPEPEAGLGLEPGPEPVAGPEGEFGGRVSAVTGQFAEPQAEPAESDTGWQYGAEVIPGSGIYEMIQSDDIEADFQNLVRRGLVELDAPARVRPSATDHGIGFLYGLQSGGLDVGFTIIGGFLGAPAGPPGTALGAGGGYQAAQTVRHFLGIARPEDLPPELRAGAYAGEAAAGGALVSALPRVLATTGAQLPDSLIGRWLNSVIEKARTSPRAFMTLEAQATLGAAAGEAVAETLWPGETGKRMAASVTGAFVGYPLRALSAKSRQAISYLSVKTGVGTLGPTDTAARELQTLLREAGENPVLIAKALRQARPSGAQTAAQTVPSEGLARMEAELINRVKGYSGESGRRARESFEILRESIATLETFGDPQSLRQASLLRTQYYEGLLEWRLAYAEALAVDAARNIPLDSPAARLTLKKRAVEILDSALSDARAIEREKWNAIQHRAAVPETVTERFEQVLDERLLPGVAENLRASVKNIVGGEFDEVLVTSKELLKFRSNMLNAARKAASEQDMQRASIYGDLAEAALEDLGRIPGADTARAYSRALNDVFTRSYAGDAIMKTTRQGAPRMSPEQFMGRATAMTADKFDIRAQELEAALRFNLQHTDLANKVVAARALDEMLDIQQRLIRYGAANTVGPDGLVNPRALERFRHEYQGVLKRMPEVDEVLKNAETAQRYFDEVRGQATRGLRVLHERAAFAKVAGMEIPQQGLEKVLSSPTPMRGYKQLAQLARSSGPDEVAGLRRTTLDVAFHRAGGSDGSFSFGRFRKEMFEPRRVGEQPLADLMTENGIMTKAQRGRLEKLLREAENIEFAASRGALSGESIDSARTMLEDFTISIIGARAGAKSMFAHQSGATLVAAAMGRRVAHHLHYKLPSARVTDVLAHAALTPEGTAMLLERQLPDVQFQLRAVRQLYGVLLAEGIMDFAPSAYEEVESRIRELDSEEIRKQLSGEFEPGEPQWGAPAELR